MLPVKAQRSTAENFCPVFIYWLDLDEVIMLWSLDSPRTPRNNQLHVLLIQPLQNAYQEQRGSFLVQSHAAPPFCNASHISSPKHVVAVLWYQTQLKGTHTMAMVPKAEFIQHPIGQEVSPCIFKRSEQLEGPVWQL